jgi:hypothetical protein
MFGKVCGDGAQVESRLYVAQKLESIKARFLSTSYLLVVVITQEITGGDF